MPSLSSSSLHFPFFFILLSSKSNFSSFSFRYMYTSLHDSIKLFSLPSAPAIVIFEHLTYGLERCSININLYMTFDIGMWVCMPVSFDVEKDEKCKEGKIFFNYFFNRSHILSSVSLAMIDHFLCDVLTQKCSEERGWIINVNRNLT